MQLLNNQFSIESLNSNDMLYFMKLIFKEHYNNRNVPLEEPLVYFTYNFF